MPDSRDGVRVPPDPALVDIIAEALPAMNRTWSALGRDAAALSLAAAITAPEHREAVHGDCDRELEPAIEDRERLRLVLDSFVQVAWHDATTDEFHDGAWRGHLADRPIWVQVNDTSYQGDLDVAAAISAAITGAEPPRQPAPSTEREKT